MSYSWQYIGFPHDVFSVNLYDTNHLSKYLTKYINIGFHVLNLRNNEFELTYAIKGSVRPPTSNLSLYQNSLKLKQRVSERKRNQQT